jgi:soluble lytic murein transglycosylase-like protein
LSENKFNSIIPDWALRLNWNLIVEISKRYQIDPCLTAAIIWTESKNDTWAMRYEHAYKYTLEIENFAKMNGITGITEEKNQKTSWGLMQVMGGVARELGMTDQLNKLCKANVGINFGCKKLRELFNKYSILNDVVAAYNAGSPRKDRDGKYVNQEYVDTVTSLVMELKIRTIK